MRERRERREKNCNLKQKLRAVWIPKTAIIVWLVIHDRLDTQDKLLKWGLINSMSCVFCRANVEDRNHLFFGCHFTAGIWMRVLRLCGNFRMPRNWENEFLWVMGAKGKSFFFFWIIKNLLPKGQRQTKEYKETRPEATIRRRKKGAAPPL